VRKSLKTVDFPGAQARKAKADKVKGRRFDKTFDQLTPADKDTLLKNVAIQLGFVQDDA